MGVAGQMMREKRFFRVAVYACMLTVSIPFTIVDAHSAQQPASPPLPPLTNEAELDITANFCDLEPRRELCSAMPKDVVEFSEFFVYTLITHNAQNPFDLFSWRLFIALNWPVNHDRAMTATKIGTQPDSPRHWQAFPTRGSLFDSPGTGICPENKGGNSLLLTSAHIQAGGYPLIDQNGNYVLYDVRVNPVLENYIETNNLESIAGQEQFQLAGNKIDFPRGFYDDKKQRSGGRVGAIVIKTAWRILAPGKSTQQGRYFRINGLIEVDENQSLSRQAMCLSVELGLVGMHIMQRTESGNGADWIWTTFEHVDNAPFADNARGPNNIFVFSKPLFPDECAATPDRETRYSFHDPACTDCASNRPPAGKLKDWKWASHPPYARYSENKPLRPTQVTRCWLPSESTHQINLLWQEKLAGTVWQNYALSTTQWKGANEGQMFPSGGVPRFLTNSTIETYVQADHNGTCLGCHIDAVTAGGSPSNFSFILTGAPATRPE